jgi:hypothetical protein
VLKLSTTFKVKNSDIDHGSGLRNYRRKLEKLKRTYGINDLEAKLTSISTNIVDPDILVKNYTKQNSARNELRNFCYGPKVSRLRRSYELQRRRFLDRLCLRERNFVKQEGKEMTIMFI